MSTLVLQAASGGQVSLVGANTVSTFTITVPATTGTMITSGDSATVTSTMLASGLTLSSPTLTTPNLGTPSAGVMTNVTGLPLTTGVTGTLPVANGGTGVTTSTGSGSVVLGTSPAITTPTVTNPTVTNYTESVVAIGNSGTTQTLSLTSGTVQTVTLTGNCTFTMPTATAGKSFILIVVQDGTGGRTATFTSVKWPSGTAPTITTTATTGRDILTFVSDGTNWYGTFAQNFS